MRAGQGGGLSLVRVFDGVEQNLGTVGERELAVAEVLVGWDAARTTCDSITANADATHAQELWSSQCIGDGGSVTYFAMGPITLRTSNSVASVIPGSSSPARGEAERVDTADSRGRLYDHVAGAGTEGASET
jgi:hypothetical protein